jgi:cation transport regulator ChaB
MQRLWQCGPRDRTPAGPTLGQRDDGGDTMPERTTTADLPGTLKRSPKKAQETWAKTHDSAVETYGEGERAHRTAFSALKHSFEKVGDRWRAKERRGPSDPQAARGGRAARERDGETFGGVDVLGSTKDELHARARALDVRGRSSMTKAELARAIARKQD